ncbi:MAG: TldD/PmbA family protein [Polyangiaceae bacterium]|nr:TldD/PmbA family protein [Polyangiaceae bacterium]MCE7889772.1 TldD/PmbA family protein [Sorangiineae bacterium PRO1]MCL4753038.1 TldD/PmbA family protein [Myxococcales bacterium]
MPGDPRARELCAAALHRARSQPDVSHVEVRWLREKNERLRVRDGAPDGISRGGSAGFSIRLIAKGAWGFACTQAGTETSLGRMVDEAIAVARASSRLLVKPVRFPERAGEIGEYASEVEVEPFSVPLEQKLADLAGPEAELRRGGKPIHSTEAWMHWTEIDKLLVTSEGTDVAQRLMFGGAGMSAIAVGSDGRMQRRSYPGFPGSEGLQGGYEIVARTDLLGAAPRVRAEAIELLAAEPCPEGVRDVVLGSNQMALQIHESCGHPTELDRALGAEISLAGGSFLQPSDLGKLRYGSDIVTLTADSVAPMGLGTFGWDDEGTPAGKVPLVEQGVFVDYLSSRETAAALGRESTGTVRADGWNRVPMIRMVNVSLEPRSGTLEDLIADTADGILLDVNQSWSIDDLRLNFQFSCELAWEIKHGKRVRLLRDARYTGITPKFWQSCDAICGAADTRIWGLMLCGKGDPIQTMAVAHAAPPARFRKVEVGHT